MKFRIWPVLAGTAMALGLAAASAATVGAAAPTGMTSLVQTLPKAHLVRIDVRADSTAANAGLNFDGYAFGRLVFSVPRGWRVQIVFQNMAPLPHSLVVEPWQEPSDLRHPRPAFVGAQTPHPYHGTAPHKTSIISFIASKAGRYRLACAVPGHRDLGMWDTLVVSTQTRSATVRATGVGTRP